MKRYEITYSDGKLTLSQFDNMGVTDCHELKADNIHDALKAVGYYLRVNEPNDPNTLKTKNPNKLIEWAATDWVKINFDKFRVIGKHLSHNDTVVIVYDDNTFSKLQLDTDLTFYRVEKP